MKDIYTVVLTKCVSKQLRKIPVNVLIKLQSWINAVGQRGLYEVRKIPGYHDEPLHGERFGQRSIRLNKFYRAIYVLEEDTRINFVEVIEVNKHEY